MLISFDEVRKNNLKSMLLVIIFFIITALMGYFLGYFLGKPIIGIIIAVIIGVIYTLYVFNSGDSLIIRLNKARPVTKKEYPYLYHVVEGLTIAAGLKKTPKCYVIEDEAMNAFATGKNPEEASIVVTTGLLKKLKRDELEGVIAHEMSHIKNNDIKVMMLAAVLVGVIMMLSQILLRISFFSSGRRDNDRGGQAQIIFLIAGLILAIISPIIAELIRLAISRKREFMADANAAILTRYPKGLANALRKIAADTNIMREANKASAHLFINDPFRKKRITNLFSTHPPIEERIRRLEQM